MLGSEFSGCWLKIRRAEEHAKTISDEIIAWEKANPYVLTKNNDPQGRFYSITAHLEPAPDWDRWSLVFGDCIHNLRSALDHLIFAVAVSQTKANTPDDERVLQFPIADTPEKFASQASRIKSLSEAVKTSIEGLQPFKRGHQLLPPLLALVRDFDNSDKHRLLNIAASWQHEGKAQIECPSGHLVETISYLPGEIYNRADIVAFTIDPPSNKIKYEYETAFTVGVSHNPGPTGIKTTGVRKLLGLLCEEVRTVIDVIGNKA